jgi:hypothetical protein
MLTPASGVDTLWPESRQHRIEQGAITAPFCFFEKGNLVSNKYGFGDPKDLNPQGTFQSDDDLAMTARGSDLFLVWKGKDDKRLLASRFRSGGWIDPVETGQETNTFPAVTVFQDLLYVFWLEDSSKQILFGTMDPESLKIREIGAVPIAATKTGVSAVTYKNVLYVIHIGETIGISGRDIYQATYDGEKWSADRKVEESQASKDAPNAASFSSRLYMTHRGRTDGVGGNTVYYSYNDGGDYNQWTKNEQAGSSSAQHRPGIAPFGDDVVIAHNGDTNHDLRLVYRLQGVGDFTGGDKIGSSYVSTYAPALAALGSTLYMVFADRNNKDSFKVGTTSDIRA